METRDENSLYTTITKKQLKNRQLILFVTANDHEKEAILDKFQPYKPDKLERLIGKNTSYVLGRLGNYAVAHVHCGEQGSSKPDAAINTIKEALQEIEPKAIVMVGICFGRDERVQHIGDVLISTAIYPYEYIKVKQHERIDRNNVYYPNKWIVNLFKNFIVENSFYSKFSGILISGEKLIDSNDYKSELIASLKHDINAQIIGGDMESAGLASVMHREGFGNWIVVKAICDFGSNKEENKETNQIIAARNAVHYCESICNSDYFYDLLDIKKLHLHPGFEDTVTINQYEMFFYRQAARKSFEALAKTSRFDIGLLRRLEGKEAAEKIKRSEAERLRKALGCGTELYSDSPVGLHKTFYDRNKNKHAFFPTIAPKAVIFDFDGTFCTNYETTWQMIWKRLGYGLNEANALHRKFTNEEITHTEWCAVTEKRFMSKRLTKSIVESVADSLSIVRDLGETLAYLEKRSIELYICSGSIDTIIDRILGNQKQLFRYISCNQFQYDESGYFMGIYGTRYDFKGKRDFIEQIVLPRIKAEACLYIGNSNNDEYVAQSGINTLVVNPSMTDQYKRNIWTFYLGHIESLKQIYPFVFPFG